VASWTRAPEAAAIYADALTGRAWRSVALVRSEASIPRPPKWRVDRVASMSVRARAGAAAYADGLVAFALSHLEADAAAAIPFKDLLRVARERRTQSGGASASSDDTRALRDGLFALWLRGAIDLIAAP
jgi:hypothetical protein